MGTPNLAVDDDLMAVLGALDQPVEQTARNLMVVELFRCGAISGGKAAEPLGLNRLAFIRYAADLGIPCFDLTVEEWEAERTRIDAL